MRLADGGGRVTVEGHLSTAGNTRPLTVHLNLRDGGALSGTVALTQSALGIRPYRGLMAALKVRDDVEVVLAATLPSS